MTPFVGKYASRFDMRMLATIAFIVLSMTSFLRSNFNLQVDYMHVAGVQLIMGIGVALFFMPVLQILLSDWMGARSRRAPAWPRSCVRWAAASRRR